MSDLTNTLDEMCELVIDCPHFTPEWTTSGYLVIRNQNIRDGRLDLSERSYTHLADFERRIRRAKPRAGDIIFTREAPMGEVCLVPEGLECCVGQRQVLLRPARGVDHRYLFYALRSPAVRHQIFWNEGTGSTVSNVRIPVLKAIKIHRLGHAETGIGELLGSLDDKIDLNRQMNETLEGMAQAIFRDWFVDFGPVRRKMAGATNPVAIMGGLTPDPTRAAELAALFPDALGDDDLPVGWSEKPLDQIADFLNGLALQKFPAQPGEPSLPVIKIAELRGGLSDKSNRASPDLPERYIIRDGDFLFSWSGSLMAKVWTEGEGALNQHLFKVSSTKYPQWFYARWVHHHMPEFQSIAASKATTMGHIQRGHLSSATTVCPPDNLLDEMSKVMDPLWQRAIHNDLENRTLAETRDYLLPRLMSGEVRVGDAALEIAA